MDNTIKQDTLDNLLLTLKETESLLNEENPKVEEAKCNLRVAIQWVDQELADCFTDEEK